jgi:P27 family predicted phage terminase small subunit
MTSKTAPKNLDAVGKSYWHKLVNEFGITARNEKLIETIAENYSIIRRCEDEIKNNGIVLRNEETGATKLNPACTAKNQTQALMSRLIKTLCEISGTKPDNTLDKFFKRDSE